MTKTAEQLFDDLLRLQQKSAAKLPPVQNWNPALSGDMDLRIDREGRWIHEGTEIQRKPLYKLFASILIEEEGEYFLVTPVEKWRIQVDVAPLFIIECERVIRDSVQAIHLKTSTDDEVTLGPENPLWIEYREITAEPTPLVTVRNNLNGLVNRTVFYQLVEWGRSVLTDSGTQLWLDSLGESFLLGSTDLISTC